MYIIKKGNSKLSAFIPNDLPVKKYNAKKDCWTVSAKNIFQFSDNNYYIYDTFEKAQNHLLSMLHTIHDNADRYDYIEFGEESVIKIWNKLKIYKI